MPPPLSMLLSDEGEGLEEVLGSVIIAVYTVIAQLIIIYATSFI